VRWVRLSDEAANTAEYHYVDCLDVSDSTSSTASLKLAKRWLSECNSAHTGCRISALEEDWFPTRLLRLDVSETDTGNVRLIITANDRPDGPYATLSHCWGNKCYIQLTKSNLIPFLHNIQDSDMPKTFQEAIIVCRTLGISYLWIDSLCIMQDDILDWSQEAGLMHKIYTCSYCNISASDAEDGTHGLFRQRDPSKLKRIAFEICRRGNDGRSASREFSVQDRDLWNNNVRESIITKRGWVFQERLLARRVLHFANDQIFWECRHHSACEKYPEGIVEWALFDAEFKRAQDYTKYALKAATTELEPDDLDECYFMWACMIDAYTTTSLTQAGDKLVAISGIAQAMATILHDGYCAGLWRRNLEGQLLWRRGQASTPYYRPTSYRAPSWSWASLEGTIETSLHWEDNVYVAHVEAVVLVNEVDDSTGQVRSGYLDLRGDLKPLCLAPDLLCSHDNNIHIVTQEVEFPGQAFMKHIDLDFDLYSAGFDVSDIPASTWLHDSWERRLFYMVVLHRNKNTKNHFFALMLRVVAGQKGTFERIGLFEVSEGEDPLFASACVADLPESVKEELPCLRYEGGKHTIRII
jgi:hypothetical protein